MKIRTVLFCLATALRAAALPGAIVATVAVTAPSANAAETVLTQGSGTSTITDLVFNPDDSISIVAEQNGKLARFGAFTGIFNYLAVYNANSDTFGLTGTGFFQFAGGDKLNVTVNIVEKGLDYPRPYAGVLTVTGGTGRFDKARGSIVIWGTDEESLTDGFQLLGTIVLKNHW